jgi:hypothetical protein
VRVAPIGLDRGITASLNLKWLRKKAGPVLGPAFCLNVRVAPIGFDRGITISTECLKSPLMVWSRARLRHAFRFL